MRRDTYDLDRELQDLIERKFELGSGGGLDVAQGVARARRRIARNLVAATVALMLVGAGGFVGIKAIPNWSRGKPAATHPTPTPTSGGAALPPGAGPGIEYTPPYVSGVQTEYFVQGIAAADGSVWALSGGNLGFGPDGPIVPSPLPDPKDWPPATLYRIDPESNTVSARFEVGAPGIVDLVAAFDALWVLDRTDGSVVRVDPKRNRVVGRISVSEPVGAVGLGDSLWVVTSGGTLSRIDPASNQVISTLETGVAGTQGIVAAKDRLWLRTSSQVVAVDPSTAGTVVSVEVGGIASFARDGGQLWATACAPKGVAPCAWEAVPIDPSSGRIGARVAIGTKLVELSETDPSTNRATVAIEAGSVWVAAEDELANPQEADNKGSRTAARLLQIDPSSGRVVMLRKAFVGNLIGPPLIAAGYAWLIDEAVVVRVDLSR